MYNKPDRPPTARQSGVGATRVSHTGRVESAGEVSGMHVARWAVNHNRGNVAKDVCALVGADDALCQEWDTLALATAAPPFLRPGWVRAWMAAFAPRRQLQLLTVRRDEQLVALLPVVTRMRQVV